MDHRGPYTQPQVVDHLEIERKYDVDDEFAIPDLHDVAGCVEMSEPGRYELVACYFDTEDLRLARARITLRRRTGGIDAGWTLKLPGSGDTRREITVPLGHASHDVPPALAALAAAHARGAPLVPVAELTTIRLERNLLGRNDVVLAKLADDTVTGHRRAADGTQTAPVTWRELEVELVNGSGASLKAFGKRLRRHGARRSTSSSKLGRVLGSAVPQPDPPAAVHSAGDALVAFVQAQNRHLHLLDPMVRLADHDDDSVHLMRVTTRSIYYALRTHRRLLDADHVATLQTELRWLAGMLSELRDLEVMRARLAGRIIELAEQIEMPAWMQSLSRQEQQARSRLREGLLSPRYFAVLDLLDTFIAKPPLTGAASRAAPSEARSVLRSAWRKMSRAEAATGGSPAGEQRDTALHTLRKKAKRAVQAAQAATALGVASDEVALAATRLEELLGLYRDGVIAQHQLQRLAQRRATTPGDAYLLGQLAGLEHCHADRILAGLPDTWRQAASCTGHTRGKATRKRSRR